MMTITNLIASLCMGMTIFLGQKIGEKKADEGGRIIGSGLMMFMSVGLVLTIMIPVLAPTLATIMHAPVEAWRFGTCYCV